MYFLSLPRLNSGLHIKTFIRADESLQRIEGSESLQVLLLTKVKVSIIGSYSRLSCVFQFHKDNNLSSTITVTTTLLTVAASSACLLGSLSAGNVTNDLRQYLAGLLNVTRAGPRWVGPSLYRICVLTWSDTRKSIHASLNRGSYVEEHMWNETNLSAGRKPKLGGDWRGLIWRLI